MTDWDVIEKADAVVKAIEAYRGVYFDSLVAIEDPVGWARATTDLDQMLTDAIRDYQEARK